MGCFSCSLTDDRKGIKTHHYAASLPKNDWNREERKKERKKKERKEERKFEKRDEIKGCRQLYVFYFTCSTHPYFSNIQLWIPQRFFNMWVEFASVCESESGQRERERERGGRWGAFHPLCWLQWEIFISSLVYLSVCKQVFFLSVFLTAHLHSIFHFTHPKIHWIFHPAMRQE